MATRAVGPGHGWSWLTRAVNLGSHNPKALLGAAAIMLAIAMVPTVLQLLFQQVAGADNAAVAGAGALISVLYALLVVPPAMAGFLRVIHAIETGAPTRAAAVLDGYRQQPGRVIGLSLLLTVLAVLVVGLLLVLFGGSMMEGLFEFMAAAETMNQKPQGAMPSLPEGFGTLFAVLLLFAVFFNGVYAVSMGQLVLGGRGIGESLRDGFAGAVKNVLPLAVLMVVALVLALVLGLALALVMGLLGVIGSLISPAVGMLLIVPFYLMIMLAMYVVMFGVMYFMWRDICADGGSAIAAPEHQVEV